MKGYLTSYVNLFQAHPSWAPGVSRVEIPLIQRDYAQGRPGSSVKEIRISFVEVLLDAVTGGEPVGLDFVYGKVEEGTLYPLDGQQRLTTIFLLHWYLASAADRLDAGAEWTRFSYATRPSARLFCQRLVTHPLPKNEDSPSEWIIDQAWYLHVWQHDPTIQAMLVMIDAIHNEAQRLLLEPDAAWGRITDTEMPAVSFYLLPLDDMYSDEDLYIKMNSRGKPLTPFESFKARFEQDIQHSNRADNFAHKVDGPWSDLLWPFHGGDNIVDDEFLRYISFTTEICELRQNLVKTGRLGPRARAIFGDKNEHAHEHLDFLFDAFDTWQDKKPIDSTFTGVLSTVNPGDEHYDWKKVVLFGATDTNLFEQCCRQFNRRRSGNRLFTLQQSLFLYAFLLHLIDGTDDFPRRLRVLRNLIAASEDEVRRPNMPILVKDVKAIIINGDLDGVHGLSSNQVKDERIKREFLDSSPELADALFRLEDHPILRGNLSSFEFQSDTFRQRAHAFEAAFSNPSKWLGLTGALLATGDYQRQRPKSAAWQFGTSSPANIGVWRYILTNAPRDNLPATRTVLANFLDELADADCDTDDHFDAVMQAWLAERKVSKRFDWRYYLVKYPSMRGGDTGIYYGVEGKMAYSMCMLRKTQRNSLYRDPILLELWMSSGAGARVQDPWFTGHETNPRWLRLVRSGVGIRVLPSGFTIQGPDDEELRSKFIDVCGRYEGVVMEGTDAVLQVPQEADGDDLVDAIDRIAAGAAFLNELVQAGL